MKKKRKNDSWFRKFINGYFIIGIILTITIFCGGYFIVFHMIYQKDLPIDSGWYIYDEEAHKQVRKDFSISNLQCRGKQEKDFFTRGDMLICSFEMFLNEKSIYHPKDIWIEKHFRNYSTPSFELYDFYNGENFFYIYLTEEVTSFWIELQFENEEGDVKTPLFYKLKTFDIKEKEQLKQEQYNKLLLLIAILTGAFVSVWVTINNLKQILETSVIVQIKK